MCSKKKQRIVNVYKRAQLIINKFKQEYTIKYTNFLFKTLFPNSPLTSFLLLDTEIDQSFKNILTFKDLNINKEDIINIFISEGILPKNFLSLELPQNELPKLKSK
jgi:fructose-bisphosphate aldolase class 1